MTPEQAYNELADQYRLANKCPTPSQASLLSWANMAESWAEMYIRHYNWSYRRAEAMVNRCRELAPLALQHQP